MKNLRKILALVAAAAIVIAPISARADFVTGNTPLTTTKVDLFPLPAGANPNNYVVAADYNSATQASIDLRTAITQGSYLGFSALASAPTPINATNFFYFKNDNTLHFKFGATDATIYPNVLAVSSPKIPYASGAGVLSDSGLSWDNTNKTTTHTSILNGTANAELWTDGTRTIGVHFGDGAGNGENGIGSVSAGNFEIWTSNRNQVIRLLDSSAGLGNPAGTLQIRGSGSGGGITATSLDSFAGNLDIGLLRASTITIGGAGAAVTTADSASWSLTPSGALTLTAGSASTWNNAGGTVKTNSFDTSSGTTMTLGTTNMTTLQWAAGSSRAMSIATSAADTNGNSLIITAGRGGVASATGGGTGGVMQVGGAGSNDGGASDGTHTAGAGGQTNITGGSGGAGNSTIAGALGGQGNTIGGGGGAGTATGAAGSGGGARILGGAAGANNGGGSGVGGAANIQPGAGSAGSGSTAGGNAGSAVIIGINGGAGTASAGAGGGSTILGAAGAGGTNNGGGGGAAGTVTFTGGVGSAANGASAATVGGLSDYIAGIGGAGSASAAGANGGQSRIRGGNGGASAGGGAGGTGGGAASLGGTGGAGSGSSAGGVGGATNSSGGVGGAGTGTALSGNGGNVQLFGGAAGADGGAGQGTGGTVDIRGGAGATNGTINIGVSGGTTAQINIGVSGIKTGFAGGIVQTGAQSIAAASSITINPNIGSVIRVNLSATAITSLTISAGSDGQMLWVEVVEDGTGTRTIPTTWTNVAFPGGTYTASTGANKHDMVTLIYNTTFAKWIATVALNCS